MTKPLRRFTAILSAAALLASCGIAAGEEKPPAGLFDNDDGPLLRRFSSETAFKNYVRKAAAQQVQVQ